MKKLYFIALVLNVGCLAACSADGSKSGDGTQPVTSPPTAPEKSKEPVTLVFYSPNGPSETDEAFMEQIGNPIQKKFPYITVKFVHPPDTNPEGQLDAMMAAGESIDIFLNADLNHYRLITPYKFEYDISDMIKKSNFDLSRLDDSSVQAVRALSKGGLYALPYRMNVQALLYNKDVFDKFGVPYPKDGMTWDDVYELAKQMTRMDGDKQYRGFVTQTYNYAWMNQLSAGFVDPKSDKALYNSDERWTRIVRNLSRFYEIPGNALKENSFSAVSNVFYKDKLAAMYAYFMPTISQEVNWDVVTYPEYGDRRGIGPQANLTLAYITSMSKHKDAAFDAIAYMTSDEFQMNQAKKALSFPVTKTQAVKDAFGQDADFLKGKNMRAVAKSKPAPTFEGSPYSRTAAVELEKIMYQLGKGQGDVNTAIRTITELADKSIDTVKAGKK
ncbi:ABC transporter substrate-binding protein [Paenibacillus allorhizosphaerae]|uniref:ABC transporter substrate-binding protein n=1 Tax=Paenibacillus allorhizosphaerae TaxID=2849866 RepID=UPI001C404C5C|nr:extracellular solute-binding protein [Paenibacillus allorhizosphaerae]